MRLTLRTVRGSGKVYHTAIRRALLKGWRRNAQTGGLGRLTDCKVQSKGHTQTQGGQKCWTHIHRYTNFTIPTHPPCTCLDALYPSDQPFIIKGKTQDEEKRYWGTDGVIGRQIGRDRAGRLESNLNVLSDDCHWHSYGLA